MLYTGHQRPVPERVLRYCRALSAFKQANTSGMGSGQPLALLQAASNMGLPNTLASFRKVHMELERQGASGRFSIWSMRASFSCMFGAPDIHHTTSTLLDLPRFTSCRIKVASPDTHLFRGFTLEQRVHAVTTRSQTQLSHLFNLRTLWRGNLPRILRGQGRTLGVYRKRGPE